MSECTHEKRYCWCELDSALWNQSKVIRAEVIAEVVEHFRRQQRVDEGNWSHEGIIREIEREFS